MWVDNICSGLCRIGLVVDWKVKMVWEKLYRRYQLYWYNSNERKGSGRERIPEDPGAYLIVSSRAKKGTSITKRLGQLLQAFIHRSHRWCPTLVARLAYKKCSAGLCNIDFNSSEVYNPQHLHWSIAQPFSVQVLTLNLSRDYKLRALQTSESTQFDHDVSARN